MKFKLRVVFFGFLSVALLCLLLLLAVFRETDVTIAKENGRQFYLSAIFGTDSKKKFSQCLPTPVSRSTADIRTINIWDNLTMVEELGEYKVHFPDEYDPKYAKIPADERLTVLIVPHSHNDPGWQKTLTDYYNEDTKYILNNIVQKMTKYPDFKMIWAETVFLAMWYDEAPAEKRDAMRKLIDNGQLDIVTGGWVMPDEASTHYYSIIDQLIEGHQWLLKKFGVKPKINWSIDPFGHSGTVSNLWRLANFDWMVVQRVHQAIKDHLGHYQKLQFRWRQSWDREGQRDMMCHMMPYESYDTSRTCGPNDLICRSFKFYSQPAPDFGRPGTDHYELSMKVYTYPLYKQFRMKAKNFQHNTIMVPLGGDFTWSHDAEYEVGQLNFTNIMNFMNSKPEWNIEVKFGTLSEYFELIKRESPRISYPSISGDFFVYSEFPRQYWSGYFTSRPLDKFVGREVQSVLKAADVLHILAVLQAKTGEYPESESYQLLEKSRRNLGLYQHHDAITGTAKPHVVKDYEDRLAQAYLDLQNTIRLCTYHLLRNFSDTSDAIHIKVKPFPDAYDVYNRNFHYKLESGKDVVVFNPTAMRRTEIVTITFDDYHVKVLDRTQPAVHIPVQISPVWHAGNKLSSNCFDISFLVDIPPWSLVTYAISESSAAKLNLAEVAIALKIKEQNSPQKNVFTSEKVLPEIIDLENACLKVTISSVTGMVTDILDKRSSVRSRVNMEMISYKPGPLTGAYLFYPAAGEPRKLTADNGVIVIKGALFSYVKTVHPLYVTTVTLYNSSRDHADCWAVHIDNVATLKHSRSEELMMRFNTDVDNKDIIYTDGNGLEMVKHRRFTKLPVQAAFYPMTERVTIQDTHKRLTLLSAQPHGVASLSSGQLDVMLDRTFVSDDGKGLNEGIMSNEPAPSRFALLLEYGLEHPDAEADYFNPTLESLYLSDILQNPLRTLIADQQHRLQAEFVPRMSRPPCDANIISFRPLSVSQKTELPTALILQRRAHQCGPRSKQLYCDHNWDTLSFQTLFVHIKPSAVKEMSLSYTETKKLMDSRDALDLLPMDIRSYSADWQRQIVN